MLHEIELEKLKKLITQRNENQNVVDMAGPKILGTYSKLRIKKKSFPVAFVQSFM